MFLKVLPPNIYFEQLKNYEEKTLSLIKNLEAENKKLKEEIAKHKVRISLLEYRLNE